MDIGEIYKGYVPFAGSAAGKVRPALFLYREEYGGKGGYNNVFYKVTTQYANKSDIIKAKCYPIKDWAAAGLHKPSYVDTNRTLKIDDARLRHFVKIGSLTANDLKGFLNFDTGMAARPVPYEEPTPEEIEDVDGLEFEP
jgi:hypothetical protein